MAGREVNARAYCAQFGFTGPDQQKRVGILSGGERNRVHLARLLKSGANLILLDEPTNDLDIESLELLEATLAEYAGTLLLVSHDRAFVDNVATQSLVAMGGGLWREYAGGYSDAAAQGAFAPPPSEPPAPPPRPEPAARPAPARTKLSFKEQRELESAPARIEALESELAQLQAAMTDPAYHRVGAERMRADRERGVQIEQEMALAFERWSELEGRAARG